MLTLPRNELPLGKIVGRVLLVLVSEHRETKYSLKIVALLSKFVTSKPFSSSGGMFTVLFLFINLFSVDEFVY